MKNLFIRLIWSQLPFGYLCRYWVGAMRVTLDSRLYVVTDAGRGTVKDAIPVNMVSQSCLNRIESELVKMGYKS